MTGAAGGSNATRETVPPPANGSHAAGRLERIWIKRAKLGPMDPRPTARLVAGEGIAGNADRGGRRQVTVIQAERWADALAELAGDGRGPDDVDPSERRANLMVSGVALAEARGRVLRIGGCRLLIRGETRPCERMERARAGLKAALGPDWRGGVYGEVIEGGDIAAGDPVALEAPGDAADPASRRDDPAVAAPAGPAPRQDEGPRAALAGSAEATGGALETAGAAAAVPRGPAPA